MIPPGLYGMADAGCGDVLGQVRLLAEEGVAIVQLRCKGWPDARLVEAARYAAALGMHVVINDRVDAARTAGVWVHLGQEDGPDPDVPFGRSTHTLAHVGAVGQARYLGFGPIFGTTTKETAWSPRGLAALAEVVRVSPIPVVAIGGIGVDNVDAVRATGVHAWAVIAGIWGAPEPRAAIRRLTAPGPPVSPGSR